MSQLIQTLKLFVHPALNGFPELNGHQMDALLKSIEDHGIQQSLVVTPSRLHHGGGGVEEYLVYDGRHRLHIAKHLKIPSVPVVIRPINDEQVVPYALESAVIGRQLTKSAIALIVFEKHEACSELRSGTKGGRPRKETETESQFPESLKGIAQRYNFPREYLSDIHKLKKSCRTPEKWEEQRFKILYEEVPVTRLLAGLGSSNATKGTLRADPVYAAFDDQGQLHGLIPDSFKRLKTGFSLWNKLPVEARAKLKTDWEDLVSQVPDDLKEVRI